MKYALEIKAEGKTVLQEKGNAPLKELLEKINRTVKGFEGN